jgi:hypothetical protein
MDFEVKKALEVYAVLSREKSGHKWLIEACDELGFDINSLKNRSLDQFHSDATNNAVQRLRYEHYVTRRNFKIEKIVAYLADRGFLNDLLGSYGQNRRQSRLRTASASLYRRSPPCRDYTFLTDLSVEDRSMELDMSRVEKFKRVTDNLANLKLEQEKRRLELLQQWSQRYSKLEKDQELLSKERLEKTSLKEQKRQGLLAKHLEKEANLAGKDTQRQRKAISAKETPRVSFTPEVGRHDASQQSPFTQEHTGRSFRTHSACGENVGQRLLQIQTKQERSEVLAQAHRKSKSSTAATWTSKVNRAQTAVKERDLEEEVQIVTKILKIRREHKRSAVISRQISRDRQKQSVRDRLSKELEIKKEKSQRETLRQKTDLIDKERAIMAKEASHVRHIHKLNVDRLQGLELSTERQLLRQLDQRRNLDLKQRMSYRLKGRVLQKQLASEEHVRRLKSAMEHRSQVRRLSNAELKRHQSIAKERLDEELSKLYKTSQRFFN